METTTVIDCLEIRNAEGKHAEAERLCRLYGQSLEAARRVPGKGHPSTLKSMDFLADFLERRDKSDEAKQLRDEKTRILSASKEKDPVKPQP